MGIFTDKPIRQVWKEARRFRIGESSPHRYSLCATRQRLGGAPVRHLFESFRRACKEAIRPVPVREARQGTL
jgi:hypothetical protein